MQENAGGSGETGATVPADAPNYTRDSLDGLKFEEYAKRGTTSLAPVVGPCRVSGKQGLVELGEGWTGYIALDADGDPYPVELDVAERTYVKA